MSLKINKNLMQINHTALRRSKADIQWIVVHYVGALGDAKANTDYYRSTSVGASADFWVGHGGDVWQGNDYYNYYSWHCGGGRQSSGGGKYYGICKNSNSIGIEMCVKKKSTRTMNATDQDWYFTDQTVASAAQLVAELMHELDIDIDHVIRHYDVNGKICPNPFVYDTGDVKWADFKALVKQYYKGDAPQAPASPEPAAAKGIPTSKEAYIEAVGQIARKLQAETGILASVVTAQACLETGFGLGSDARVLVEVNNLLGMKTDLINFSWAEYSAWDGKSIMKKTPEYYGGKLTYVNGSFRAYTDYEQCLRDYEMFLLHVRNNKGLKYARIAGMTDARQVIHAIRIGAGTDAHPEGYCTDPNYETKVLKLIDQYDLHQYDLPASKTAETKTTAQAAQKPAENARTRLVAACHEMNAEMIKSQQTGAKWGYYNSSTSPTFAKAIASGNYRANCATTANWALKMIKAIPGGVTGFYGDKGGTIKWKSAKIKEAVLAVADVISVGGKKTVNDAINDGTIIAGDIVTYYDMRHTNTYLGGGKWLDSGHAYANGQGDGAGWSTWIGNTYYGAQKVGSIIRLKVTEAPEPTHEPEPAKQYRVQVGAYRLQENAAKIASRVRAAGFACIIKQYGQYWIAQCGIFSVKANADALAKRLKAAGFAAGIEQM